MSAIISPCGRYRYRLERTLDPGRSSIACWVMVNPSTADATQDDATIRKVIGFSDRLNSLRGVGKIVVVNKFAYRATDIKALRQLSMSEATGPENITHIQQAVAEADYVIFAWGPLGKLPQQLRTRWQAIAEIAAYNKKTPRCFGTSQDGQPRHPLMLAYDTPLQPWTSPCGS